MRRLVKALAIACALGAGGCTTPNPGIRPQAVESQADTYQFRIYTYAFAVGSVMADRAVDDELLRFRAANGYASSEILSRDYHDLAYVYTVKFTR